MGSSVNLPPSNTILFPSMPMHSTVSPPPSMSMMGSPQMPPKQPMYFSPRPQSATFMFPPQGNLSSPSLLNPNSKEPMISPVPSPSPFSSSYGSLPRTSPGMDQTSAPKDTLTTTMGKRYTSRSSIILMHDVGIQALNHLVYE